VSYPTTDIPELPDVAIYDGYTIYDPEDGQEHDVVVGLDSNNNTRVYVHLGTGHEATSTASITVGTGSKSFTGVASGLGFKGGERVRIQRTSAPTTTYMTGRVSTYVGTTLTVIVSNIGGSGTHTDWSIYGG